MTKKQKNKLSSRLTFAYKYFVITFFTIILIFLVFSLYFQFTSIEKPVLLVLIFFSILFILLAIPLVKLKYVSYDKSVTCIKGFRNELIIQNKQVKTIKRYMLYFYKITYNMHGKDRCILFLPHIGEVMISIIGKPKSIRKYQNIINAGNASNKQMG